MTGPTPVRAAGAWTVQVRDDDGALDALAPEWDDLAGRCAAATPFQSSAWLAAWWGAYGTPGDLRLVLVRGDDGALVAAAPFVLCRRAGAAVLRPLGGALADFTDVLVDDAAPQAARWLADALLELPGWHALDLPETRPGAVAAGALFDAWPGGRWSVPASVCLELPGLELAELAMTLPKHTRKTVRTKMNKVARSGIEVRCAEAADAGRAVADLLRLHADQWRGRGVNPEHLSPAFAAHLGRSTRDLIAAGGAELHEYRLDGELVASSLVYVGRDHVGAYLYGADPALRDRVDVMVLLLGDTLGAAHRRGRPTLSMLRGTEAHKARWRPVESLNRRVLLARPGSGRGAAYAARVRGGRRAVLAAKEHAPWLRDVRDRLRRARGGAS